MLASDITDSIEQTLLVRENNIQKRWSANAGISKFIFAIKLNTSLKVGYNFSSSRVVLDNEPTSISNNVLSASIQFSKRFFNLISPSILAGMNL